MVIGIIGGGASGMAAALFASENPGVQVVLMERQARLGRKLAATGNGRCNLSNLSMKPENFHGEEPDFVSAALGEFSVEQTLGWFHNMGLFTMADGTRVYPFSEQASSVVDILRFALDKPNITLKLGFEAEKIKKTEAGFLVQSKEETLVFDRLIIACGGLAGTKLGGSMSGYKFLRTFGHKCTKLRPSLVQLKSGWKGISALKGVRAVCRAAIYRDGMLHGQSEGEIQFTEYGLSGPVMFEISRDACQGGGEWSCRLDLLPHDSAEVLREALCRRRATCLPVSELLTGIVHNRIGRVITQTVGIPSQRLVSELTDREIEAVCTLVKDFEITLTEPMGMDSAQVTAGGILTREFYMESMESRLIPGLYACGEVLDIDGDCGGYNLQWAWSSGRLAGIHAGGIV